MMEADLRTLLLADTGVAGATGGRVTWGHRPQGSALPAVVLHRVGGAKGYHINGESGPFQPRVQVNCLGETDLAVTDLFGIVQAALSGYAGTVGNTYFQGILQDSESQELSDEGALTDQRIAGLTADFIVNHTPV